MKGSVETHRKQRQTEKLIFSFSLCSMFPQSLPLRAVLVNWYLLQKGDFQSAEHSKRRKIPDYSNRRKSCITPWLANDFSALSESITSRNRNSTGDGQTQSLIAHIAIRIFSKKVTKSKVVQRIDELSDHQPVLDLLKITRH